MCLFQDILKLRLQWQLIFSWNVLISFVYIVWPPYLVVTTDAVVNDIRVLYMGHYFINKRLPLIAFERCFTKCPLI